jgi:tellurite resistance protein TerC
MADRFSLLKYGLAAVLVFIGLKMLLIDIYKIPVGFSLSVVATFIGISIWLSLRKEKREQSSAGAGRVLVDNDRKD